MATDVYGQLALGRDRNPFFEALLKQASDTSPIQSPWQGASRLAFALLAGLENRDERQQAKDAASALLNLPGLGGATPAVDETAKATQPQQQPTNFVPTPASASGTPNYPRIPYTPSPGGNATLGDAGNAIAGIESGGSYDKLGPVTGSGDRAYGRYQVMGANIPQWTQEALGRSMTPQEFLNSPQAQEAVFANKFDQYRKQFGSDEAAARAWFAGPGGMNNPNARDQLGTTVGSYAQRFLAGLPQSQQLAATPVALPGTGGQGITPAMADAYAAQNPPKFSGMPIVGPGGRFTDTAPPQYGPGTAGPVAPSPIATPQQVALASQGATPLSAAPGATPSPAPPSPQQVAQAATQQPAPPQFPQATPQRAQIQIPPQVQQQVRAMLGSGNPVLIQQGLALYNQYSAPKEQWNQFNVGGTAYQRNSLTGEVKPVQQQPFAVNVNQQGQTEFEKTYGEGMAKEALSTVQGGDKALENIQQVQLVRGLLNNIQTGKLTPAQATIGGWMQSVGLDPKTFGIDPNLPATAETAQALMSKMALSNIGGQGGIPANNFSEADRKFVVGMTSSLSNRPEANEILLDAKERISQLAIEKADAWAQARDAGIGYEKFNSAWRKELSSRNVFGDLIAKSDALKNAPQQAPTATPAQPGVRRYNPATGRIE